jgi:hypothetical protein
LGHSKFLSWSFPASAVGDRKDMKIMSREIRKPHKESRRKPYVSELRTNPTQDLQHCKTAIQHPASSLRTYLLHNEPTARDHAILTVLVMSDDSPKYGKISEMKRKNKTL